MASRRRTAFSLVDLVAVIVVVGVLFTVALPLIDSGRGGAHRIDCENRQKQIVYAAHLFQVDRGLFPGYWMPVSAKNQTGTTWPLTLSGYLDQENLWKEWNDANIPAKQYWDLMVCPSNKPKTLDAHWLSYVANCGLYKNNTNPADGVCTNQLSTPPGPKTSSDSLPAGKGESYTLFFSENTLGIVSSNTDGWLQTAPAAAVQYTGFCWQAVKTPNEAQKINGDKSNPKPPMPKTVLTDYARPASNHPGGVVAAFCDGHIHFLREDVAYSIYQLLMTTNPAKADFPAGSPAIGHTLTDEDF